jgi:predicted transcriptional regulator
MSDHNEPNWRAALRSLVMLKLRTLGPMTNRELANACRVSEKAIAPRLTELTEIGEVMDSGRRKSSLSGKGRKQVVWEAILREPWRY